VKKINPTIKIIFISLCFGLFFWVLDAFLQFFMFRDLLRDMIFTPPNNLFESLLTQIPTHSLVNRIYVIVVSFLGGTALAFYTNGRYKAQQELEDSEQQMQTLLDAMPNFICFKDGDGRWLKVNNVCVKVFQLEGIDYRGKKDAELAEINNQLQGTFLTCKDTDARAWEEGTLISVEETISHPDGSVQVYDVTKVPVFYPGGERKGLIVLGHDITRRKETEKAVRESEQSLNNLVEKLLDGVAIADENAYHIYTNPKFSEITGYSKDELQKLTGWAFTRPEDRPLLEQRMKDRIAGKPVPSHYDRIIVKKDGTQVPVEMSTTTTIWRGKERPMAIIHDLTMREQAERSVREERDFSQNLIDTAQTMILVLDVEGKILRINPYMEEISGYKLDEVKGKDWFSTFLPTRDHANIRTVFQKAVDNIEIRGNINPIVTKDGRERQIDWYNKTLRDDNGNVVGVLSVGQDITERMQAEDELKQYTQHLEALRVASLSLTANLSLQAVLDVLLESALQLVSADDAHIYVYDGKKLRFGAVRWIDGRQSVPFAEPRLNGLTYKVARSGKPIIIPDMSQSPIFQDWPLEGAIIGLPLLHNEQVVGVMNVASDIMQEFGESELRILYLLADQAAIAINNARLYEEVQRHVKQLETLNTVTAALTKTLELDKLLELIFDQIRQVMSFDSGAIFLYEEDGLRVVMDRGITPSLKGTVFPTEDNLLKQTLQTQEPLILNDPKSEPGFKNWGQSETISSWMGVPLVARDTSIGFLTLDSSVPEAYSSEQVDLARIFASQAAHAIENARLYERVIADANQLEERVQERTAELKEANEGLESFTYSISHDLRAPLRGINGFTQILMEEHTASLNDEAKYYMNLLHTSATNMSNLIDGLLDFSRKSLQPLKTETVNLTAIAENVVADLAEECKDCDVDFQLDSLPPCQGDSLLLRQVFYNLIQNALKFTRNKEKALIEIKSFQKDGFPVYYIKDNGVGFDMTHADKLFGVFQRAHLQSEFEGTGVGLAIVHKIIRRHGGEIWFEAQQQHGATFYFTINNLLRKSHE